MQTYISGYTPDVVAKQVFSNLLRDFRQFHGQDFAKDAEAAFHAGIGVFREYE